MGQKARLEMEAARRRLEARYIEAGIKLSGNCVQCGEGNPREEMEIRSGPRAGKYFVCAALPCGVMFAGEADFNRAVCGPRLQPKLPPKGLVGGCTSGSCGVCIGCWKRANVVT